MKETKYKILIDYGSHEGMRFWDDKEYETIDEAVKNAIALNSSFKFLIVKVVDWEAN